MIEKEFRQNKERKIKNPKLKSLKLLPRNRSTSSLRPYYRQINAGPSHKRTA
jgi:hypothetical protein